MAPRIWRDQFYAEMGQEGIKAETSARFLRISSTLQRLAEAQCNGDFPANHGDAWPTFPCSECGSGWARAGLRKDGRCLDCHATERAKALVAQFLEGWSCEFQGDPRGCVLKLRTPAGREIGVP